MFRKIGTLASKVAAQWENIATVYVLAITVFAFAARA
jgi:hypothetical protein